MNCYLVTLDHPRNLLHGWKSLLKFHVNPITTFRAMGIWNFCKFGLKRLFPTQKFTFWGILTPRHYSSSSKPPKGTSLGESASFNVYIVKIRPPVFAVGDDKRKKGREGKGREGKGRYAVTSSYISPIWGADPVGPISTKICMVVGVHDVIIHSNFGVNIFRGLRSTGGRNFRFPITLICWNIDYGAACDIL